MSNNERYFDVTYESGAVEKVKPLPRAKWADAMELQQSLLEEFMLASGLPGTLLSLANKKVWSLLDQFCLLLPTISGTPLDLDQMDADEILQTFFTATVNRDEDGAIVPEGENKPHQPSRVARLHGFGFFLFNGQGLWELARAKFLKALNARQEKLKTQMKGETLTKEETLTQKP